MSLSHLKSRAGYHFWKRKMQAYEKIEAAYMRHVSNRLLKHPPVFIIGPPRSGTSLLYQSICHSFGMSFFSNHSMKFGTSPMISICAKGKHFLEYESDFISKYGMVAGANAPHEAGEFWNRWFPQEAEGFNYVGDEYLSAVDKRIIYQTVANVEHYYGGVFINKNVKNSVRIDALLDLFPQAVFLSLKRNLVDNCISIFRMREKLEIPADDWYSVMPKEVDRWIDKGVHEKILGQVLGVQHDIDQARKKHGESLFYEVDYDRFCQDPNKELEQIGAFYQEHTGAEGLEKKLNTPDKFQVSRYREGTSELKEIFTDLISKAE